MSNFFDQANGNFRGTFFGTFYGTFYFTPTNPNLELLPNFKSKLEGLMRGENSVSVLILDDSTGAGWGSSDFPENMFLGAWPELMAQRLRSFGYPAYSSFASPSDPAATNTRRRDDRFTIDGSPFTSGTENWANFDAGFGDSCHFQNSSGLPVRFTPGATAGPCDKCRLYWIRLNTGNIEYNINGGSWQTITTTGSADIQSTEIDLGSLSESHYIEYRMGTAWCFVVGVEFYSSTPSLRIINGSIPAAQMDQFTSETNNWTENAIIDAIAPDLVIAGGGINEFYQSSKNTATLLGYHTTLRGQLANVSSTPEYMMKTPVPSSESAKTGIVAAQLDIVSGYASYGASNDVPVVDLYNEFGGEYDASRMSDLVHPNDDGYSDMANIMADAIRL